MQTSIQDETPLDPMDIARVARLLWRQAGSQPGRYAEYWSRVEQALTYAQNAREIESLNDRDLLVARNGLSNSAGTSKQSGSATMEQMADGSALAQENDESNQSTLPVSGRVQTNL